MDSMEQNIQTKKQLTPAQAILISGGVIALAIILSGTNIRTWIKDAFTIEKTPERVAAMLGVNKSTLDACIADGTASAIVERQGTESATAGARGTPFGILRTEGGKTFVIAGAMKYDQMKSLIDEILANPNSTKVPWTTPVYPVAAPTDHMIGAKNPKITIIEYSDLDCPYCKQFQATMHQVVQAYPDSVAWIYRHSPIDSLHPDARHKAIVSECVAAAKGNTAFWKYIDTFLEL